MSMDILSRSAFFLIPLAFIDRNLSPNQSFVFATHKCFRLQSYRLKHLSAPPKNSFVAPKTVNFASPEIRCLLLLSVCI